MDIHLPLWYDEDEVIGMAKKDERFIKVYEQGIMTNMVIYLDRETGVQYLISAVGSAGGITPLLGPDGKPLLGKIPQEDEHDPWNPWG